jgi:hypothetical protein
MVGETSAKCYQAFEVFKPRIGDSLQMSESLEDKLKAVATEIANLEVQVTELSTLLEDLYKSRGIIPIEGPKSHRALEELYSKLNNARQRQLSLLLSSISDSSNRLEAATRNLQQSSEAQVRVAESQVKVSESQISVMRGQSKAIDALLNSSHRLEQFTIFLLVIGAINVFIIEETTGLLNGPLRDVSIVAFVVAILGLTFIAFRWVRAIRKNPDIPIP